MYAVLGDVHLYHNWVSGFIVNKICQSSGFLMVNSNGLRWTNILT